MRRNDVLELAGIVFALLGAAAIVGGIAMFSFALAFIAGGLFLIVFGAIAITAANRGAE